MTGKSHMIAGANIGIITILTIPAITTSGAFIIVSGCILGSILPDIDSSHSIVNKPIKPVGHIINKLFGHRTIFHSLLFLALIYFLIYVLNEKGIITSINQNLLFGILLGVLSHFIMDFVTIQGIPLFYPFSRKRYSLKLFKSGMKYEILFVYIFSLVLFVVQYYHSPINHLQLFLYKLY